MKYKRTSSSKLDHELVIQFIRQRDGDNCRYCGRKMTFDGTPGEEPYHDARASLEHLKSLYQGGPNTPENVALVCRTCNLTAGDGSNRAGKGAIIKTLRETKWVKGKDGTLHREKQMMQRRSRLD